MKLYKIYFDYNSLKLNGEGEIINENDSVYIIEYEWDEDSEASTYIRRVNGLYRHYDEDFPMDISLDELEEMESLDDYFDSVQEAWDELDHYLEDFMIWRTIYMGYYQPEEYECVGLEDRDEIYYRTKAWAKINSGKEA